MEHQIWDLLEHQGRSLKWLAARTGYSEDLVKSVKAGRRRASPDFRQRCATALDTPEAMLFRPIEQEPAEVAS